MNTHTHKANFTSRSDHIPMDNSSNVPIAIAILLKWEGTRVKEGIERGKKSICPYKEGLDSSGGGGNSIQSIYKYMCV